MTILAIDPGNEESAYLILGEGYPEEFQKINNEKLLDRIRHARTSSTRWHTVDYVAIEMIASYGMPVGREIFETCVWIGRFIEAWNGSHTLVYRRDVKMHLCGNNAAKDSNVRAALIDRFGPGKDKAIGKKASPGPLYGISADAWSALAVAVTFADGATI